ncbi:hypothetical protein LDENG_00165730, partial [Lucifuga dentata]
MLKVSESADPQQSSAAVTLLEWFDLDTEIILVMERPVPSIDLFAYSTVMKGLSEDRIKVIMKQLIEAALDMASKGVFHRDIKLENVLIEHWHDNPRIRLIDFGCSCEVKEGSYRRFVGTRAFAPPEWFMKHKYKSGPTTVWQLGGVLYELLHPPPDFDTQHIVESETIGISSKLSS